MLPERLSHYRIVKKLGEGGMGSVYLADDLVLGRQVAIKILPAGFAADADRTLRFRREARSISALNHPNIVTIHEYSEENGIHFFVTEFLGHHTLRDRIGTRCDLREILSTIADVARGLAVAHSAGVIHRDIKPENIMLPTGTVKIVDFGLAKRTIDLIESESSAHTHAGVVMGTFPYMSPEQLRGEEVESRTDVFSLGVILYEWLTGRRPFKGQTMHAVAASILTQDPAPLSRSEHVPERLERLLSRMLSKEPQSRPDAEAVHRELESILVSLGSRTQEISAISGEELPTEAVIGNFRVAGNNLPAEATALVGRQREVETLVELLRRAEVRVVTVTGPAGTGKTRVALGAAQRLVGDFRDGVYFVALEAIAQPELVPSTIAQTIGLRERRNDVAVTVSLAEDLRDKRLLLLLDNFEQVADAAPLIASLTASAPAVKVLVTSQAPLRIRNEYEYLLDPLPVPEQRAAGKELEQNPSVELFRRAAQRVKPDFTLSASHALSVAEICRQLEGVPLAIELAAVRVKLLSPEAILARLTDPMSFLVGGPRDLPRRQQAVRDAVGWSVGLLSEDERKLFARLSVFQGGWSLAAAEQVCGSNAGEVFGTLGSLVDKSLVRSSGQDDVDPRFTMLSVTRSFAQQLLTGDETAQLGSRHLACFAGLAEESERGFSGATQSYWLQRFDADQNNFRAALEFAVSAGRIEERLRIVASLWRFWNLRGQFAEGRQVLADALRDGGTTSRADLRSRTLVGAGVLANAQGDFASARRYFEHNLELCRAADDQWGIANSLNNLAVVATHSGNIPDAQSLHRQALQLWRALDNRPAVAISLQNLGHVARLLGQYGEARKGYDESLRLFRALDDPRGTALSMQHLAMVDRDEGNIRRARELYDEALQIFMHIGDHWYVANCMADYGECLHAMGDRSEARALLNESLLIFRELGDKRDGARLLELLAILAADEENAERALTLAAAATAIRNSIGATRTVEEQRALETALTSMRTRVGANAVEISRAGERLTFQDAVDFAQS